MTKQTLLFSVLVLLICTFNGTLSSQVPMLNQQGKYGYGNNEDDRPENYPYDYASYFNFFDQGLIKQNGKWSLVDNKYNIIAGGWDSVDVLHFESLEANQQTVYVMMGGKWKIFLPRSKYYSGEFDSVYTGFSNVFTYTDQMQPLWSNGKIRLMNKKTSVLSPAYDGVYFDNSNTFDFTPEINYFMKLDGKVVVTDASGIAKKTYDYMDTIQPTWDSYYAVKNNGMWNFVTSNGKLGLKKWIPDSNFFNTYEIGVAFIKQKGKRYRINLYTWRIDLIENHTDGEETYDEIYNDLPISDNPGALALVKRERYGFVDKDLNVGIPFIYDDAYGFNNGLAFVKKNGLWGGIDETGATIIPYQYQDCKNYGSEYIVKKGGKYGLINYSGEVIIPFDYDDLSFSGFSGSYHAYKSGFWGIISYNGEVKLNFEFEDVKLLDKNFSAVKVNGVWGIYSLYNLKMILEPKYGKISWTDGKLGIVVKDWNEHLVDLNSGNVLTTSAGYFSIRPFTEGLAQVKRWDSSKSEFFYGFIDETGKEVIPAVYNDVSNFSNGKVWVLKGKKSMYVDKTGKEIPKEKKGK